MSQEAIRAQLVLSLDDLVTLNDEIAALARCGISLERGLAALANDLPGRVGLTADVISQRLSTGESLSSILSTQSGALPRIYAAVVEAGQRSGKLPAALEALSTTAQRVAEMRRVVGQSLLYPLMVTGVAYALGLLVVVGYLADLLKDYRAFGVAPPWYLTAAHACGLALRSYWFVPPLLATVVLTMAWVAWSRASSVEASPSALRFWDILGIGSVLRRSRRAAFMEILALLVEQEMPLADAVELAANATGEVCLRNGAVRYAEQLRAGNSPTVNEVERWGLPRLAAWMLCGHPPRRDLANALRVTAASERRAVERRAAWLNVYLPLVLTLALGAVTTLVFALIVLLPWFNLLQHVAEA